MLLTKDDELSFDGESLVPIKATLSWVSDADLDLAAIAETDRGVTIVQALDRNFGSMSDPYVKLDQDSRSGGSETMTINMAEAQHIKRIMLFAYIYQGAVKRTWQDIKDAVVKIQHPEGEVEIKLSDGSGATCALFELVNENGGLRLNRLEKYFNRYHEELDAYYNWPRLNWTPGKK